MIAEQIDLLSKIVTERRLSRMRDVLADRSRYLTVLIEDVYQSHNASAVLRSCESFGVQDVHVVERENQYQINPSIELGTAQWLDIHRHQSTSKAIKILRAKGYRVVATTPHGTTTSLPDFAVHTGPTALLFGTEMAGLSPAALEMADERLTIPMVGFVDSLNISVSVAVILYTLTARLRSSGFEWRLPVHERDNILLRWLRQSVKEPDEHLRRAGLLETDG